LRVSLSPRCRPEDVRPSVTGTSVAGSPLRLESRRVLGPSVAEKLRHVCLRLRRLLLIFLSHSSADIDRVAPLVQALRGSGVDVWFDGEQINLSDSVPKAMSGGIASSSRMLIAWSGAAARSVHVANEIDAFYMLHPEPGAMLFLRIDDTGVPALYTARVFLTARDTASDADAVQRWLSGQTVALKNTSGPSSSVQVLQQFPRGPMVPTYWLPDSVVAAYSTVAQTEVKGRALIDRAIQARLAAEPGDPRVKHIHHGELPSISAVGPEEYWYRAFAVSALYGPRMVAALLLVQDDDLFNGKAKRDRAELLLRLRLIDQYQGGE
jgi:hypothetical protein